MSWNLNSLAKDNFHRVSLIEAHNSCFNYDLISICETTISGTTFETGPKTIKCMSFCPPLPLVSMLSR